MSDLSERRARLTGTTSAGGDMTDLGAEVPDQERLRYAIELRALTSGSGRFSRRYGRHETVPAAAVRSATKA